MKLLGKFNILLIVLFGLGLALISSLSHRFLLENARHQTLQQAELMISSARSTRDYTEEELDPLLQKTPDHAVRFLPQTIPFYAATVTFEHLRKQYPDYTYKEAALNPTNPRDRANDWEADVITYFRNHPGERQVVGQRTTPTGTSIYLAHPIAAEQGCLGCHGVPSEAPPTLISTYGTSNGFGWKAGEVIGAQIVSVPTEVPVKIASQAFHTLLIYLTVTFVVTMLFIDLALYSLIIVPLRKLSAAANLISKGDMTQPEFDASRKDEIGEVMSSFNRMYVSLAKALKMLEG